MPSIRGWEKKSDKLWRFGDWIEGRVEKIGSFWEASIQEIGENKRLLWKATFETYTEARDALLKGMKIISKMITKKLGL